MKTVYHGSAHKFTTFEIKEEFVNSNVLNLAEGLGVYMTDNEDMAANYGPYLYSIEISDDSVTDFTKRETIELLLKDISSDIGIELSGYLDLESIILGVLSGNISVTKFYKEISDWLDSDATFYEEYADRITYEDDCLFKELEISFFKNVKSILKYYDMSFTESVYVCFREPEKLVIVSMNEK
jgi:hypothetical protein